jgi:hypothetical protein
VPGPQAQNMESHTSRALVPQKKINNVHLAAIVGVGAIGNAESNCGFEEGMCCDAVVVRIELRVADEVTAGVILELDLGNKYDADAGDDAGADSDARPGGNGRGRGQILWMTTLTLPPGHPRSWFLIVVVSPSPFVYHLCPVRRSQRLRTSVQMVVETETNSEREAPAKMTSPMHPRRQMT